MNPYPRHRIRPDHCLDGSWEFAWLGTDVDLSAAALSSAERFRDALDAAGPEGRAIVPSCFDTIPGLAGARGTAAYRTWLPAGRGRRGRLVFDGLGIWAAVYADGELLHVHRKPYSPFTVELPARPGATSASRRPAPRELIVVVDNRFSTRRSPLQENYFDFYAYGGIFRPVRYQEVPAHHLTSVRVTPVDPAAGTVTVTVTTSEPGPARIAYAFDGREPGEPVAVDITGAGARLDLAVPDPAPWTSDAPHLHTLEVLLLADAEAPGDGEAVDDMTVRFGLRTVAVRGRDILLNGAPVRMFGWNRHEAHPQYGPALPAAQLEQDIRIMKAAGANFVRGSHYPQDARFLDLCDELGLMVWEESIGWQQDERHFADEEYGKLVVEQQREMIAAHANHPSIIMWGFQNELHSEKESARPLIEELSAVTREADPTRPVTFATCRFPHDRCLDLVDIISINTYPGWYASDQDEYRPVAEIGQRIGSVIAELERQGHGKKPLIVSEIGAGAIYGLRDPHAGHWSEQYQTEYLETICTEFLANEQITGLALWQFCDCRTYGSSRALFRPRGFNNKGIVDEYRRPKDAYGAVTRLMTDQQQEKPCASQL